VQRTICDAVDVPPTLAGILEVGFADLAERLAATPSLARSPVASKATVADPWGSHRDDAFPLAGAATGGVQAAAGDRLQHPLCARPRQQGQGRRAVAAVERHFG